MQIAITGASSTGKTTLSKRVITNKYFQDKAILRLNVDARELLRSFDIKNMDKMSILQKKKFQIEYFKKKKLLEEKKDNFITERSFVDVAAYWSVKNLFIDSIDEHNEFILSCLKKSLNYDLHIFIPFGLIPFQPDGYRSNDLEFHKKIDRQIFSYLEDWSINYIEIKKSSVEERVKEVIGALSGLDLR
ncbi:MAG: AAA family ATPase [Candidatus Electrothrix aestuarii]|uniref:AAA family ATPase n=1 Tax=Candidatus Electrothrix aestuarii TaxID=3062594 RepID=A0AAU8LZ26_9BACT